MWNQILALSTCVKHCETKPDIVKTCENICEKIWKDVKCDISVLSLNVDITELSSMDVSDDETHSNAGNECRTDDVFQESLQKLFTSTHEIASEDIGALLAISVLIELRR